MAGQLKRRRRRAQRIMLPGRTKDALRGVKWILRRS